VKRGIDITLNTIHLGESRRVVTLSINNNDPARSFLNKLRKNDINRFRSLKTRIRAVSCYKSYENQLTFRHVGDGIYEFKRPGLRLYAFYDDLDGEEQLILCTNGGLKKSKKQQNSDIDHARNRKEEYMAAKALPETILNIEEYEE
jgi:hypothetical protein